MAKHLPRSFFNRLLSQSEKTMRVNMISVGTSSSSATTIVSTPPPPLPPQCPFARSSIVKNSITINSNGAPQSEAVSVKQLLPYDSIPTAKSLLGPIGNLLELIATGGAKAVHKYCDMRHEKLGPIFRETMGGQDLVFIADASLMQKVYQSDGKHPRHLVPNPWIKYNQVNGIQRGLFFMDGPEWSQWRQTLNKVFLKPQTISEYSDTFNSVVADLVKTWDQALDNSDNNEAKMEHLERDLYNWSIESLGTMIFGRRLGCVAINGGDSHTTMSNIHEFVHCVQQIFVQSAKMTQYPGDLAYTLNLPVWRKFCEAAGKALALGRMYVNENIKEIKAQSTQQNECVSGQGVIRQLLQQENVDQEDIVSIIVDLFIAAADTTSHATQWTLYLLSRNPECQEKLLREINAVTGGERVEERHLPHLPYLKGIIKESLRLYPVAPFLSRYAATDMELSGYRIPSGTLIAMSLFTTGRNSQYFENPDQFVPERWIRDKDCEQYQVINTHACLPFGLGIRSCIGRRVAEMQMQFLLSRIAQKFHLSPVSDKEIGIQLRMITTPDEPIHLILKSKCKFVLHN